MNVLILTNHLNPGGVPRYVLNLAKGLGKRNVRVWVATSGGEWVDKLSQSGIHCKLIPINTKSILSPKIFLSFLSLVPLLSAERFDLVHCNSRVTQALGFWIKKFFGVPCITTFHGYYNPGLFRRLLPFSGNRLIAVSQAVKKHMVDDLKINESLISVVYNGIDPDAFGPRVKKTNILGIKNNEFVIGMLGRISAEKGHLLAIEALSLLSPHYTNTRLLISGTGKMEAKVKEFIQHNDLNDRVIFTQMGADDFFNVADLLLMPSTKEGFGFAIIESFLKGVPVIGFNVGGISEIIKDNENGMLFYEYDPVKLKEKIEEMISNGGLRKKMVVNAKLSAQTYSLENMIKGTLEVYNTVVDLFKAVDVN